MTDLDDDSIDVNLRSSSEIGGRLAILGLVLARLGLETNALVGGDPRDILDAEDERYDFLAWLRSEGAAAHLTVAESTLLATRVGNASADSVAEWSWQAERVAVVAWAASLVDGLPEHHQAAEIGATLAQLPAPWDSIADFIAELSLRSDEQIAFEIERSELWLWRAETEEARRTASRDELGEIAEAITDVVSQGVEIGLIERAPDGDFLASGQSFHRLSDNVRTRIATIASERLRAFNWLRGAEDDWDHLSADI